MFSPPNPGNVDLGPLKLILMQLEGYNYWRDIIIVMNGKHIAKSPSQPTEVKK